MNRTGKNEAEMFQKRAGQLAKLSDKGEGRFVFELFIFLQTNNSDFRSIEELKNSQDILKGQEAMRLRMYCTVSNRMEPNRDLDTFGNLLLRGTMESIIMDHGLRVKRVMDSGTEFDAALETVAADLYALRWGPTQVPLYNLLGLFSQIVPDHRLKYHAFAEFFINTKVPVDGRDLSGTAALSHCFSTKPCLDLEYAQMLYDAGGDVNSRNRFGATVAHEIVMVYGRDPETIRKAAVGLEWFVTHGGNLYIADGDGMAARKLAMAVPRLAEIMKKEEERRHAAGAECCALCGRDAGAGKLLTCGRCKSARYCSPATRACQKLDWPRHKKACKC